MAGDTEPSFTELVNLNSKCNQRCVFCAAEGLIRPHGPAAIAAAIKRAGRHLTISGWEPTLHPRLPEIVTRARARGVKNITLFTNAILLDDAEYARRLVAAGVTTFHINFPSHLRKLSDLLTGTPGSFERRLAGIRNVLEAPRKKYVSLVFVMNSLNYRTMPACAAYIVKNFPGLVHVLFTTACVMGRVRKDRSLVPKLSKVRPYLAKAQAALLKGRVKCLVENVPICLMPGFEHASFDARQALLSGRAGAPAKAQHAVCRSCSLNTLCPGLRDDYFHIHGDGELKASRRSPGEVARKVRLLKAAHL